MVEDRQKYKGTGEEAEETPDDAVTNTERRGGERNMEREIGTETQAVTVR